MRRLRSKGKGYDEKGGKWYNQETVDRESLWIIQTPQAFIRFIRRSGEIAEEDGFLGTDEAMLVERLGDSTVVESTYDNVKMTTKEDLLFGEAILNKREQEENNNDTSWTRI